MPSYYTATGAPVGGARGLSAAVRSEFELIQAAFAMISPAGGTAVSIPYTFSTTTAEADPGSGTLRLNNATQNTATAIYADLLDANGATVTDVLALFDDSTTTPKGFLKLTKVGDSTKWLLFSVASMSSPSGYRNITVTNVASSAASPFSNGDSLVIDFVRTGDKGADSLGYQGQVVISGTTTVTAASHKAKVLDVTTACTLNFNAAAVLGSDFYCWVAASDVDVTINSSDGVSNWVMYSGAVRFFYCDGTTLRSKPMKGGVKTWTSSGTHVWPPGIHAVKMDGFGSGGGGGSGARVAAGVHAGGGGGGGGAARYTKTIYNVAAGTSTTVTIAAAAAGGAAVAVDGTVGNSGSVGGSTTFGTSFTAYGGGSGQGGRSGGETAGGGGSGWMGAGASGAVTAGAPASSSGGFGGAAGGAAAAGNTAVWGGAGGGGTPNDTSDAAGAGGGSLMGAGAGGGGGHLDSGNSLRAPGAGGTSNSVTTGGGGAAGSSANPPTAGTAGTAGSAGQGGAGGGGGGSATTQAAAIGGAGALPGGGGGGGGGSRNGNNSGAGGAGGAGQLIIAEVI